METQFVRRAADRVALQASLAGTDKGGLGLLTTALRPLEPSGQAEELKSFEG